MRLPESPVSQRVQQAVHTAIADVPAQARVCVGLSGGLDSVTLLHAAQRVCAHGDWALAAIHVHHGLSPNAQAWATFCERYCASLGVPLAIERVTVARDDRRGLEAAAREARYAAFARVGCDAMLLAHHADDQAETVLFRLLRGTGVAGLAGMAPHATIHGVPVRRPFLTLPRALLVDYAHEHALEWIDDESNAASTFSRNLLRNEIVPRLDAHFGNVAARIGRSAAAASDAVKLLDDLARIDLSDEAGGRVRVSTLATLSEARALNVLRHLVAASGGQVSQRERLGEALRQLLHARGDAQPSVRFGAVTLRRYAGSVIATRDAQRGTDLQGWTLRVPLGWGAGMLLACESHGQGVCVARIPVAGVTVRTPRAAERVRLAGHAHRRTLKHLFQEHAIAPWLRETWPVICVGDAIACVPEIGVAHGFEAAGGEAGWRIDYRLDEP